MVNGILSTVGNMVPSGVGGTLLAASADDESSGSFMIKLFEEV